MAEMKYSMVGDEATVKEEGYSMIGKDSDKGKGMGYEMAGGKEEVGEKDEKKSEPKK